MNRLLQDARLVVELAPDVDEGGARLDREPGDQRALDELVRIPAHDLPILASTGLALVGVDTQVLRQLARLAGHEAPLGARRETGTAATAHSS